MSSRRTLNLSVAKRDDCKLHVKLTLTPDWAPANVYQSMLVEAIWVAVNALAVSMGRKGHFALTGTEAGVAGDGENDV